MRVTQISSMRSSQIQCHTSRQTMILLSAKSDVFVKLKRVNFSLGQFGLGIWFWRANMNILANARLYILNSALDSREDFRFGLGTSITEYSSFAHRAPKYFMRTTVFQTTNVNRFHFHAAHSRHAHRNLKTISFMSSWTPFTTAWRPHRRD